MAKAKAPLLDRWLPLREAAEYLGCSTRTLRRYAHSRQLAYSKRPGKTA
ncbi:helix-turn-helix domain-containing protein [bacterium]|nr:helix-turn-helix domain-containing protein [bacterium]